MRASLEKVNRRIARIERASRMQNENGMVTSFVLTAESAAILTVILVKFGAMDFDTEGKP